MSASSGAGALRPSARTVREIELDGVPVRLTSYRIGARHTCHVDNVEPGAVIGRGSGANLEEAEAAALALASLKLSAGAARMMFGNAVRSLSGGGPRGDTR